MAEREYSGAAMDALRDAGVSHQLIYIGRALGAAGFLPATTTADGQPIWILRIPLEGNKEISMAVFDNRIAEPA